VTKTGHGRRFTLPPAACKWLQAWREVCPTTKKGWVFPGQAGQPLSVRGAQGAITKLAEKVGIEGVSSHSFRRSALTAAHQAGLSLREVAEISGHHSLAALERYLDQDAARVKAEASPESAGGVRFGTAYRRPPAAVNFPRISQLRRQLPLKMQL
jgi:integrase/recombinase XerD